MKGGGENRRKTIIAGALGTVALICIVYAYNTIFGASSAPPPAAPVPPAATKTGPASAVAKPVSTGTRSANGNGANGPAAIPGVAAQRVATTSSSLDPTLDQTAMLRTENLIYSGVGRNIFSATYTPPPAAIPKQVIPPRPTAPPVYTPPVPTGPPPPPPINLKFFGTATRANGSKQAFFLQGEDVYLASTGDIVARKYKIGNITTSSVQVTDLQNNNTQSLPLQMQ